MEYELTVDLPTAGDTSVLIVGIGEVKNGTTVKVDAEQARQFKILTGSTLGRANFMEGISAKTVTSRTAVKKDDENSVQSATPKEHPLDVETVKDGDK